jgi:hypothetical protein
MIVLVHDIFLFLRYLIFYKFSTSSESKKKKDIRMLMVINRSENLY